MLFDPNAADRVVPMAGCKMPSASNLSKQVQLLLRDSHIPTDGHELSLQKKAQSQMNEYLKVANWKTHAVDLNTQPHDTHLLALLRCLHNTTTPPQNVTG